jgi:hypothetical protein
MHEFCERWKACGFWPVYAMAINPNVLIFAWKSGTDAQTRADQEMESFFGKKKKSRKSDRKTRRSKAAGIVDNDGAKAETVSVTSQQTVSSSGHGYEAEAAAAAAVAAAVAAVATRCDALEASLEAGILSAEQLSEMIQLTPHLEAQIPSIMGPILSGTAENHRNKAIIGWHSIDKFQAKLQDSTFRFDAN